MFRYWICLFLFMLVVTACLGIESENGIRLIDTNRRHAWLRGEEAIFDIGTMNSAQQSIKNCRAKASVEHYFASSTEIDEVKSGQGQLFSFRIDTRLLKAGAYSLRCELLKDDNNIANLSIPFRVARRWNKDRMPIWLWGGGFGLGPDNKQNRDWHIDKGFNCARVNVTVKSDQEFLFSVDCDNLESGEKPPNEKDLEQLYQDLDEALCNGWDLTLTDVAGGFFEDVGNDAAMFKPLRAYGSRELFSNPFHPQVSAHQDKVNCWIMSVVGDYPNLRYCWFNTEVEDFLVKEIPLAYDHIEEKFPETTDHRFIVDGVIPDNDEAYIKRIYRHKWGDGLVIVNKRAANMVHRYRPDVVVFSEPYRLSAIYDRFRGLDAVSTWTYTQPDPKYTMYVETLIAAAKPTSQQVIHTVTMLNYAGTIFPKDKGWTLMGPDRLIESMWINLSRKVDALSLYYSSACLPLGPPTQKEPYQKYPPSFEAFKRFIEEVVRPYGPMIVNLQRSKRRVAVLSSQSSRIYSNSPTYMSTFYGNYQIYEFYILLNMIHIPADVIFDETVAKCGLGEYDVLVLPKCETLLESVYDEILAFEKRGGLVIADQYLRAPIPNVVRFDFDLTHREKVTADAIAGGKVYYGGGDTLKDRNRLMKEVEGVTALEDQKVLESYAAELREGLGAKITRDFDCDSPRALMNVLEYNGAKYLFIVNDNRTYGERVGRYKAILEKAVPHEVTISMRHSTGQKVFLYDILSQKQLKAKHECDSIKFRVDLPAPGGKIIAFLPQEIAQLEVIFPDKVEPGACAKILVLVKDAAGSLVRGVQAVEVSIKDPQGSASEFSDYYACVNGKLTLEFIVAKNDPCGTWSVHVEELMSGQVKIKDFTVQRTEKPNHK